MLTAEEKQRVVDAVQQTRASILARTDEGSDDRSDALYALQDLCYELGDHS